MAKETKINFNMKGLEDLTKQLNDTYRARVGVLGGDGQRQGEGGITNAELAVIQIFGSLTKNIPPRDFLFMPVETHKKEILNALGKNSVREALTAGDYKKAYGLLGAEALKYVLMAFETSGFGNWPPNKESTAKRKGSDRPLIDTGQLRRAQTFDVVKKGEI